MSTLNMAFRSLGRRRLRMGLTVSGIVVGVTVMFILLSLISGMDVQVRGMVRTLGGADITVSNATTRGPDNLGGPGNGMFLNATRTLPESLTQTIDKILGVYAISPQLEFNAYVGGNRVTVIGIDPATYSEVTGGLNVVSGSSISNNEKYKIVLGKAVADSLAATIGESVTVGTTLTDGEPFTVVGIFETGTSFQEYTCYIPLEDAQTITNQEGLVTEILVKCEDPNDVSSVSSAISASIPNVRVTSQTLMVSQQSQMLNTLTMFFTALGLVAIFAGSFGVANTMLMSVSESTREIGTLKAIGARNSRIMGIFLTEALLIGSIGGGIGVIVGVVLSYVFPNLTRGIFGFMPFGGGFGGGTTLPTIAPTITLLNIVLCFSLGTLVGVLAGFYPAWRAARMKPVEAFRHV